MKSVIAVACEHAPRKDNQDALRCARSIQNALRLQDFEPEIFFCAPSFFDNNAAGLDRWLRQFSPDCVFNLFEGFSNDAYKEVEFVQALERNRIAFTGNNSQALAACLDKFRCKGVLEKFDIPVPQGIAVMHPSDLIDKKFRYPVFIKPRQEDASVGIDADSLCFDEASLIDAVDKKVKLFAGGLIVEEFVEGPEYNVSFTGHGAHEMLAISRIDYAQHPQCLPFISYESKWDEGSREYQELTFQVEKDCPREVIEKIKGICQKAAEALMCQGYFRIDLRERDGTFYVLDVNPNPDINEDSGFIRQAQAAGFSYGDMIKKIFLGAIHDKRKKVVEK